MFLLPWGISEAIAVLFAETVKLVEAPRSLLFEFENGTYGRVYRTVVSR